MLTSDQRRKFDEQVSLGGLVVLPVRYGEGFIAACIPVTHIESFEEALTSGYQKTVDRIEAICALPFFPAAVADGVVGAVAVLAASTSEVLNQIQDLPQYHYFIDLVLRKHRDRFVIPNIEGMTFDEAIDEWVSELEAYDMAHFPEEA